MRTLLIRGEDFHVHDNEDISNAIVRDKDYYEDHILDYIRDNFPTHNTIVDVGAMIGNHSNYFARFLAYNKILAFEPTRENFEILALNTEYFSRIITYKKALSNYHGLLHMEKHFGNWGMHGVSDPETWDNDARWHSSASYDEKKLEEVEVATLDSYNLSDLTLLKIDVEYYEPFVLQGARETIARCKPLILIEDVRKTYSKLPELQGYSLVSKWPLDFTYLYKFTGD